MDIHVKKCEECPFLHGESYKVCEIDLDEWRDPTLHYDNPWAPQIPDWCPLRKGDAIVQLEAENEP